MKKNKFKFIIEDSSKIYNQNKFKFLKKKNILITGATGLLGQYFIGFFLNALDSKYKPNKITLIHKSSLPSYLNFLNQNNFFKILKLNLSSGKLSKLKNYDYIIHAATYAQPSEFIKNAHETINLNTYVTYKLIRLLKPKGKFLFISSSEIYSGINKKIINENISGITNLDHIRACYIEAKRCGEVIVNEFRKKKVNAVSARLCLAYGPGFKSNDGRVLSQFIKKTVTKKEIKLVKGHNNIRSYIYITDVLKMLLNILFKGKQNIYNVGGNSKVTILSLAKKITKLTSAELALKKNTKIIDDGAPDFAKIDIKRYKKEFGKMKFVKLHEGLKKTISWYKILFN